MNDPDLQLNRLVAAARGSAPRSPGPAAPPGFARSVVSRWLAAPGDALGQSWLRVSRGALAWAVVIMMASLAAHSRTVWRQDPPEQIASAAVVSLFLPK